VIERSTVRRHKVCGEFFSPEILPWLERLGVAREFCECGPAQIRRMTIRIGRRERTSPLSEPALGLSRFCFDQLLLSAASARGAELAREGNGATIIASGRRFALRSGERLFGFKAHFEGPADDAVALYFFNGCYAGVSPVERGWTNVCGIAPEQLLRDCGFQPEHLVRGCRALAERLCPLSRRTEWVFTGPLEFRHRLNGRSTGGYLAGDALSFVDPFTGSGILSAVATGTLAGEYAARREPVDRYAARCRRLLARPFAVASALRWIVTTPWAERLLEAMPGEWLYRATRPRPV
jgi:hypothetical protein